jgi:UDP-N-acetylmuramoylalanine--D-glutamate ligase
MEASGELDGVRFVNDSKATNVDAAARSIESFDRVVAIVGGRYKGGEFADLAAPLVERGGSVVAIGEAAERVERALGPTVTVTRAESMGDAVRAGFARASPGATVVLAPACSSFDMFRDYAERGRRFKEEVQTLAAERRART